MAISRNSTTGGSDDSSSFNITIGGDCVITFVVYDDGSTLSSTTLGGVSGTILRTGDIVSEGYKISTVSYFGSFSGSKAVVFSWTGGTPSNIRSRFLGYNGATAVDVSSVTVGTGTSTTATVTNSNCWIVGGSFGPVSGLTTPTTGTNNDGYVLGISTNITVLRATIGDSNGTVSTGSQSVTTGTENGYNYCKHLVAIQPSTTSIKTVNGLSYSSVKTVNGLAVASVKTINGLA